MSNSPFHLLYLGEDLAWSKLSQALVAAPRASIKTHRAQSLNELFLVLAGGRWNAVALDVHAWNFQGLHYVDKVRSEYPSLPILALYSSSVNDLANKAKNVGASHTLALESLNPDTLLSAIFSTLAELHPHVRKDSPVLSSFDLPEATSGSRNQAISHALNNLLCVITANADLLAEHVSSASPGEHSLTEIKKAAKSASDLIHSPQLSPIQIGFIQPAPAQVRSFQPRLPKIRSAQTRILHIRPCQLRVSCIRSVKRRPRQIRSSQLYSLQKCRRQIHTHQRHAVRIQLL